jgi:hypothetical protein
VVHAAAGGKELVGGAALGNDDTLQFRQQLDQAEGLGLGGGHLRSLLDTVKVVRRVGDPAYTETHQTNSRRM